MRFLASPGSPVQIFDEEDDRPFGAERLDERTPSFVQASPRDPRVEAAGDVKPEREAEDLAAPEALENGCGESLSLARAARATPPRAASMYCLDLGRAAAREAYDRKLVQELSYEPSLSDPASPTTVRSRAMPSSSMRRKAARTNSSSRARPTNVAPALRVPPISGWSMRRAGVGTDLAEASPSPRPCGARRTRRRGGRQRAVRSPTRISPGAAACSSRAATLTASPLAKELPTRGRPLTTSPVLTPMRNPSAPPKSSARRNRIARAALGRAPHDPRMPPARRTPPSQHHRRTSQPFRHCADLVGHRLIEAVEERARVLRITPFGQRRRSNEVGEQNARQRSLADGGAVIDRRRAGRAETAPAGSAAPHSRHAARSAS